MSLKKSRQETTDADISSDVGPEGNAAPTEAQLRSVGAGAFFRPRDAEALGYVFRDLKRWVVSGAVEQVARGLYRLTAAEPPRADVLAGDPGAL